MERAYPCISFRSGPTAAWLVVRAVTRGIEINGSRSVAAAGVDADADAVAAEPDTPDAETIACDESIGDAKVTSALRDPSGGGLRKGEIDILASCGGA